jgi:hypothetical protein
MYNLEWQLDFESNNGTHSVLPTKLNDLMINRADITIGTLGSIDKSPTELIRHQISLLFRRIFFRSLRSFRIRRGDLSLRGKTESERANEDLGLDTSQKAFRKPEPPIVVWRVVGLPSTPNSSAGNDISLASSNFLSPSRSSSHNWTDRNDLNIRQRLSE